jgi:hypothetical protein
MIEIEKVKKVMEYVLGRESIYILLLVILNIINLCLFYQNKNLLLFIGLLLLVLYFIISSRNDKKILVIAMTNFTFWGVIAESFIITKTNNALYYKDPTKPFNVPLWLIPIYCLFCISAIYTYNIFKIVFE